VHWLMERWPRWAWIGVCVACLAALAGVEYWMSWAGGIREFAARLVPAAASAIRSNESGLVVSGFLAVAMVAAARSRAAALLVAAWGVTLASADLWLTSGFVQYAEIRHDSPIWYRDHSVVRSILASTSGGARVLARNQNSLALCDVATVPPYLGIGPQEYFGGPLTMPHDFHWENSLTPRMRRWLRWSGVTHVLAFDSMNDDALEMVWAGHDPFLHELLGRPATEPLHLYAVTASRGRAFWLPRSIAERTIHPLGIDEEPLEVRRVAELSIAANHVEFVVDADVEAVAVLTDLNYPGWRVRIDHEPAEPVSEGVFRAVRVPVGRHHIRWEFKPGSVWIGWLGSILSILGTCILMIPRFGEPAVELEGSSIGAGVVLSDS